MLSAADRVVELLRSLDEARVAYDARSRGGGAFLMPSMFGEGSYAELERCLLLMREGGEDVLTQAHWPTVVERPPQRQLWWHVCQRHRFGIQRTIVVRVQRTRTGPIFLLPSHCEVVAGGPNTGENHARIRVYTWSHMVDEGLVAEGLRSLTRLMYGGISSNIRIPRLLLRRKLGLPVEDDVVEDGNLVAVP